MDAYRCIVFYARSILIGGFMILAKIVLTICGIAMLLMGISTIVMPDVNSFFIPFEVSDKSTATLVRTYAGFFLAFRLFNSQICLLLFKSANRQYSFVYLWMYAFIKAI